MATKEHLLQLVGKVFEKDYRTIFEDAACPVMINFCDAAAKGKGFSECTVDFSVGAGFPLACFQLNGQRKLFSYLQGNTDSSDDIKRLENFIAEKEHEECLLSLDRQEYSEYNIQIILAAHLFGPLAGCDYGIGKKGFPKHLRKCPRCSKDISTAIKNTSLGYGDGWHGYADILVKRSVVKIGTDDNKEDGSGEAKGGSGEPLQKKMRTESMGDDEGSTSDESYISDSIVEVKKDTINCNAVSQVLAQTIVNAFSEVNNNSELSSSFIPSFIATDKVVRITMYNCRLDRLIMSHDLKIFMSDGNKTMLNVTTILSLWYALNFEIFFDKVDDNDELFPQFESLYKKSNFKEHAGKMYEIYKEKCTKPMTETKRDQEVEFRISSECFRGPVNSLLNQSMSSVKNVKKILKQS